MILSRSDLKIHSLQQLTLSIAILQKELLWSDSTWFICLYDFRRTIIGRWRRSYHIQVRWRRLQIRTFTICRISSISSFEQKGKKKESWIRPHQIFSSQTVFSKSKTLSKRWRVIHCKCIFFRLLCIFWGKSRFSHFISIVINKVSIHIYCLGLELPSSASSWFKICCISFLLFVARFQFISIVLN